jgi:hypothetical protein
VGHHDALLHRKDARQSPLGVGSGRAVRVWRYFFVLPDRVGFAKLKPVDRPLRWSDRAGQLTVLAGGYNRVGRVYFFTTATAEKSTQQQQKNQQHSNNNKKNQQKPTKN